MAVSAWMTVILLTIHLSLGANAWFWNNYETCDGVPCKCFDGLGCFPNRAECGEGRTSLLPESPEKIGTRFFLYTSGSQANGAEINVAMSRSDYLNAGFNPTRETKFIIHGFINSGDSVGVADIKSAFFKEGSYNIVMVDWAKGADIGTDDFFQAWTIYRRPSQNARVVAKQLSLLLTQLHDELGVKYDDMHLIGHSLGAQTAGLAAGYLPEKVGRISGLDPAKPNFQGKNPACRLDETDAKFVDVIHTDIEMFGTNEQTGDLDFWPNEGKSQPGCIVPGCSHGRSTEYYAISIEGTCQYQTQPCDGSSCTDCPKMGINADKSSERGNFCLTTTSNSDESYC